MPLSEIHLLDLEDKARCSRCKEVKSKDEFYANKKRWNGIRNDCKKCSIAYGNKNHRDRPANQKNGWTTAEYKEAFERQNGECAICHRPQLLENCALAGDHDHKTGKPRALLCGRCNRMIGLANDDPEILRAAADYIIHHSITEEDTVLDAPLPHS